MRKLVLTICLLLAGSPALAAQAPLITERGDPSVHDDTIYALAVQAEQYPEEEYVLLLDDGVVRLEPDGRASRTYRTVVQALTADAAEEFGELSFGWDLHRERFRLNWVRVIDAATGRVISDRPVHEQESLAPVDFDAPVYTNRQTRRISLGGVAAGTIIDYSTTTETIEPTLPGDFLASWSVHTGAPTRRSRYVLDVPEDFQPRVTEENLFFRPSVQTRGGRRVSTWATAEVPKIENELFAALDSNRVYASITVGGRTEWADIARWYAGLARGRYELTPEIRARVAEVVRGAATREDSLRRVHRWIAQDFRYVSLSLGIGGYQPRTPAEVFAAQYGDCKDKATLFIAVAELLGFRAYPVLLSSVGGVDEALPSIHQFDHMIAAVERPGGGYIFLDLTADLVPYGEISPDYQGEFGLVVHPDGRGEPVRFPLSDPAANRLEAVMVGELNGEGQFTGSLTTIATGATQYSLRSSWAHEISPRELEEIKRSMAQRVFDGARGDSLEYSGGNDLDAQQRTRIWLSGGRAARRSGGSLILTLPFPNGSLQDMITELEVAPGPRRFDINVAEVIGPIETHLEFRVQLPEGYRARLPEDVELTGPFGRYSARFTQEGRELRVVRTMSGLRGTLDKERLPELIQFLEGMSSDDATFIVLDPQGG